MKILAIPRGSSCGSLPSEQGILFSSEWETFRIEATLPLVVVIRCFCCHQWLVNVDSTQHVSAWNPATEYRPDLTSQYSELSFMVRSTHAVFRIKLLIAKPCGFEALVSYIQAGDSYFSGLDIDFVCGITWSGESFHC